MKASFAAIAVGVALSCLIAVPAKADSLVEQRIQTRDREDIIQNIRDQLQAKMKAWRTPSATERMRFGAEPSEFDTSNPFALRDAADPFAALAYAKAYSKAPLPPAIPAWLYGVNAIISGDSTNSGGTVATTTTGTVAVDVTKIGIFTTTDALTFLATGSDSWSHIPASFFNSSTPSGSGTLAYTNGGFSADFTGTASWTVNSAIGLGIAAPANSSMASYTGNVQYKFDLDSNWFVEPTVGFTYTDFYTANFGAWTGSSTEIHGGGRFGGELILYGIRLQPSVSAAAYEIVSVSGAGGVAAAALPNVAAQLNQLGARGAAKLNVLWTDNFSTYIEAHFSAIPGTETVGASGGLRYSF